MDITGNKSLDVPSWDFSKKFLEELEKFKKILSGRNSVTLNHHPEEQKILFEPWFVPLLKLEQGVVVMHIKGIFPKITYTANDPQVLATIREIMKQRTQISRLRRGKNPLPKNIGRANQISKELSLNVGVMINHFSSPNNNKNGDEPIAIALDPDDNAPCILFASRINEKTEEIPIVVKINAARKHFSGEGELGMELQKALGINEEILVIEKILAGIK